MAAKRKAAPKYVWVSRDVGGDGDKYVDWWFKKPKWDRNFQHWDSPNGKDMTGFIRSEELADFERLVGMDAVEPGTCRRFEWRSPLVEVKAKKRKKVKA